MRVLKFLAMAVIGLLALLLIGGLLLSPKFHVSRSVQIAASPDKVYALVASPRQWKLWSVWNQRDPAMQIDYSGPESGAGAVWAWRSKTEGDGKMSFTAAEPSQRVAYELYFPDFGTTSTGELRLSPKDGGTELSWLMDGDMGSNPLFRWLALFADGMVGKDFEAGLARLKQVSEQQQP
ncbi:SRPBCC family protein [Paucibacter sp. DJ1R-11]|uniref:SRPBCC family protein n=1 Tax=Paucibacter sp. DJ1R-11 TaxID=2893556 RepID=UPI0021E51456|nr:SRPBCC family protein [Paucibacter sp. DJ1R-11]MCV2361840.1 SRPBCC family protein [Paucibacter sp. DJ1R-11]